MTLEWPWVDNPEVFGPPDDKGSAAAPADTRSPVGGSVTVELPPPEAAAREARIKAIQEDPLFKAGDHALTIELADLLLGADLKSPEAPELPPELPPVELKSEDLPALKVPANAEEASEAVGALRAVAAYAEVPAEGMQQAIDRALAIVMRTDPVEDVNAIDRMQATLNTVGQKKYGARWAAIKADAAQAVNLLAGEHADLGTILRDPRVHHDLPTVEALAELGKRSRNYYIRRHGTGGRQVVRW